MKIENIKVYGIYDAILGIRKSYNSEHLSDSKPFIYLEKNGISYYNCAEIGENDLQLIIKLAKAGPSHRKFMRQIFVTFNLTLPLKIWKQFDTYKIGTTANSQSTMHTLTKMDLFNPELWDDNIKQVINQPWFQSYLKYIDDMKNVDFQLATSLLPDGFLQTRFISCNYEVLMNMYEQRKTHKMKEWRDLTERFKDFIILEDVLK